MAHYLRCNLREQRHWNYACRAPSGSHLNVLGNSMHAKGSRLFLVRSGPDKMVNRPRFYTDEVVPQSGIYKVRHHRHRLPHEVTLLRDQYFPRCAQCDTAVMFELVRAVMDESETALFPRSICLYELPVIEADTPIAG